MCVHFCQLRKLHLDPELYLNGTQIPIICEAKFLGLLFDSKLSFIPHIASLKSKCTKSLDLIKVLSNTRSPKCAAITGVGVDMSPHCFIKCPNGSASFTASGSKV